MIKLKNPIGKDRSQLLRELMYHYMMIYGESDADARRSIGRDLRNFLDIEDAEKRLSLIMAKKGKRNA